MYLGTELLDTGCESQSSKTQPLAIMDDHETRCNQMAVNMEFGRIRSSHPAGRDEDLADQLGVVGWNWEHAYTNARLRLAV